MKFVNGNILLADGVVPACALTITDGCIAETDTGPQTVGPDTVDLGGDWLVPGFVDIQVNGGGGVLFNDTPTLDGLVTIADAHRAFGTTSILPTLISDDLDIVDRGMRAVEEAIGQGVPGIEGIHIEGPFLAPQKRGIHDANKFLDLNEEAIALLTSLERGRTLVTLAPERCTRAQIRQLVEAGVTVSLGHTNAFFSQARAALDAGATGFTHLFNAMSGMTSREPGAVGAALEAEQAFASLIVDGHHVDQVMMQIAHRLKRADRLILISDAMPNAGTDLDHFYLGERKILVADGKCYDEDGVLAGASLTMGQAVKNARLMLNTSRENAARMAATNPAAFIGLGNEVGTIAIGKRADFVRLTETGEVAGVYMSGQLLGDNRPTPIATSRAAGL